MLNSSLTNEYFIFQNIEECELLIPEEQSQIDVNRYDSPDNDTNSKGLSFNSFWGMKFQSDSLKYEIFAYEFVDSNSALKYYVNVTGQHSYEKKLPLNSQDENKLLSASKGMSSYRIVAVYQNKAYLIMAHKQYEDEINKLLANTFSQKIS